MNRAWIWFGAYVLPVGMIFSQVTFGYVSGFPINLGALVGLGLSTLLVLRGRINRTALMLGIAFLVQAIWLGAWALDGTEFVKSMALFANLVLVCVLASAASNAREIAGKGSAVLVGLSVIAGLLIVLQAVVWNVFHLSLLHVPLGPLNALGPGGTPYVPYSDAPIQRPNALYSEPSVAGWVMVYAESAALTMTGAPTGRGPLLWWGAAIGCTVAAVSTMSLSGIAGTLLVWSSVAWHRVGTSSYGDKKIILMVLGLSMILAGAVLTPAGAYLESRVSNLDKPGSSLYYRVTAPTRLVLQSLPVYPLGHALGQRQYIEERGYMVNWAKGSDTNIDNCFLMLSYYFGIPGVALSLAWLTWAAMSIVMRKPYAPILVAQTVIFSATGSLWAPWVVLFLAFTLITRADIASHVRRMPTESGIPA